MQCLERRIADRSVLSLIRGWLQTPVQETDEAGRRTLTRPTAGTPQGGVISPLLSNLYLHELDGRWNAPGGPRARYDAHLVRYADDFVVLAQQIGEAIPRFLLEVLEGELGLTLNREKTRILNLREAGESLQFLGYTFRFDRDRFGRPQKYLNLFPSAKAEQRLRDRLRQMTASGNKQPVRALIAAINRVLVGWGSYFRLGYPRKVFRRVNGYVGHRMACHLRHRSQRRCRRLSGPSLYASLTKAGLVRL
jgi:RNA-directed DNA polymerase